MNEPKTPPSRFEQSLEKFELTDAPFDPAQKLVGHHPDVAFREVGGDIFLVHPDGETIYNLNPTAAAIWRLMDEGLSIDEMVDVITTAFPVMSADHVRKDVIAVLGELVDQGFAILPGE